MPDYFYAFFPKDEPGRTLCVDTRITGGLTTAETVNRRRRVEPGNGKGKGRRVRFEITDAI